MVALMKTDGNWEQRQGESGQHPLLGQPVQAKHLVEDKQPSGVTRFAVISIGCNKCLAYNVDCSNRIDHLRFLFTAKDVRASSRFLFPWQRIIVYIYTRLDELMPYKSQVYLLGTGGSR